MPRILAIFVALIIAVGGPGPTLAQSGADAATQTLRKQNPLIDDVARNDPDGLRELLSKLEFLIANRGSPARTGSRPTPAEAAEIAANPAIGRAYQNNPDETLVLLRATNEGLRKARLGGDLGKPRRLALVVGDNGNEAWGRLGNAPNDADLIARTLKTLDFDLVTGGPVINADRLRLQQAVRDFARSIGSETVAVFYFAGHGAQFRGNNYLVPHGAGLPRNADDYDKDLLGVSDTVLRQMRQATGRLNIVVLDACRDHPPLNGFDIASRGASPGGLAASPPPPGMNGTVIIYSTAPGEIARDRVNDWDNNSPFAAAFAGAVVKPGIEVRDTFEEIQEKVKEATKGAQQPWISYAAIGRFAFAGRLEVQDTAARILMPSPMPGVPPFAPAPSSPVAPSFPAIPPPSPHVVDRYVELKPGVSTLDDAKKLFGEPNSETPLRDGKVGFQWNWNNFDFIVIVFDRNKRMLGIYNRFRSNI